MNSFLQKNHKWLNPLLIVLTTGGASLITYDLDMGFVSAHPIKYAILQPIISNIGYVFWPSLLALGYITYLDARSKKTIEELRKEIEGFRQLSETVSENIKELFNGFLYNFSTTKLKFDTTERITIYIHDGNKTFVPFGRYSSNPNYAKKGRHEYPDSIGCISKGWAETWHFFKSDSCPEKDEEKYLEEQKRKYSIDKGTVRMFKMKPRMICALRLDVRDKQIAVIIVESTDPDKYSEESIKPLLLEQKDYLSDMIFRLKKYIPKPSDARNVEDI